MVSEPGDGVPSNPWGTGLRVEYYSFVRRRLHCLVGVLLLLTKEEMDSRLGHGRNGVMYGVMWAGRRDDQK